MDADRQWHAFLVERTGPLALARMRYAADPATQELQIEDLFKVASLEFQPADLGLNSAPAPGEDLLVRTHAASSGGALPELRLTGLGSQPALAEIEFDQPGGGTSLVTATTTWDPATSTLVVAPVAGSAAGPATFNQLRLEF